MRPLYCQNLKGLAAELTLRKGAPSDPGAVVPFPKFTPSVLFQNCYWAQDAAQKQLGAGSNVTKYTLYSNGVQQATTSAIGADNMSFSVQRLAYG